MIIFQEKNKKKKFIVAQRAIFIAIFFLTLILIFTLGYFAHMNRFINDPSKEYIMKYIFEHSLKKELPQMSVDMKYKNYKKIEENRNDSIKAGLLKSDSKDFVPATITFENKKYNVRMRLKGDLKDHWEGEKWSFRVHIMENESINGIRKFSIQDPMTRENLLSWAWLEHLKREDIITPRTFFTELNFNGKTKGIFNFEEFFSKELIENSGRREGVILTLDERNFWKKWEYNSAISNSSFKNAKIRIRQESEYESDSILKQQMRTAKSLLRGFQNGDLSTSDVFDVRLFAKYFAICELWSTYHALNWNNLNFYYNPITSLFEPIGFDGFGYDNSPFYLPSKSAPPIVKAFFKDNKFYNLYFEEMQKISDPKYLHYLTEFLTAAGVDVGYRLRHGFWQKLLEDKFKGKIINQDIFTFLYERHKKIQLFFNDEILSGYFGKTKSSDEKKSNTSLVLNFDLDIPVEILSVKQGEFEIIKDQLNFVGRSQNFQPIEKRKSFVIYPNQLADSKIFIDINTSIDNQPLNIEYKALHGNKINKLRLKEEILENFKSPVPKPSDLDFLCSQYQGLKWDKDERVLTITKNNYVFTERIVIPSNLTVKIESGSKLFFSSDAYFLSYSPILALGNDQSPIVFSSREDLWCGIFVLNAISNSTLEFIEVQNTSGIGEIINSKGLHQGGWYQTGGVVFYKSPVTISNCKFSNSYAEDSLNIFACDFTLKNTTFDNSHSDGFDGDFVSGSIENCSFKNIGGDALDFSKSRISLNSGTFENVYDKAISCGEASYILAEGINMKNVGIAFASKDNSFIEINTGSVENVNVVVYAAYRKKPEFGPATLIARDIQISNFKEEIFVEGKSKVRINSKDYFGRKYDIKSLYKEGILGN